LSDDEDFDNPDFRCSTVNVNKFRDQKGNDSLLQYQNPEFRDTKTVMNG